ncbi:MAG: ABC transporter permease [Deltaproteobacteria bacterium]|nr:ABC transporter permease [Candidatus Anaeroferrophillus wilburensis]MBN2888067.1 ABC transporter permease [Deltaproteobacteria bacterium]
MLAGGSWAIFLREMMILHSRGKKVLFSMAVSPLLYLVAFGLGVGRDMQIGGHSYIEFLIPGLVAMGSMNQSFGIAGEINIARFYWKIFEEFQASPLSDLAYVIGEVLAGVAKALMSVAIILLLSLLFGVHLAFFNPLFWLGVLLNAFVFASLAVMAAMLVKSHADQAMLFNFIITPMAFLGGTFFPISKMPVWVQCLLQILPLTHASRLIRSGAYGQTSPWWPLALLMAIGVLFFLLAHRSVCQARD